MFQIPRVSHRFPSVARVAVLATLLGPVGNAATAAAATRPIDFSVEGHADVRTGIKGRVDIAGTFTGTYDTETNRFSGSFALVPTTARVLVLGVLPVTAETDWIFTEPVTGEWKDGVLRLRAAPRIRHPRLLVFGGAPIAGGAKCATREPSIIELRSSPSTPVTDPFAGATLSTDAKGFAISALSGCGLLDPLLSAVAVGGGNQATVRLSPRATS